MVSQLENINIQNYTELNLKNNIREELEKLSYNFEYIGTEYLLEAIYLLYCSNKYYKFSLEKDVYPIIAKEYGDTPNNVKSTVIYSTDKMFYDCEEKILKKYLGKYELIKPGPKKVIRAVLKNIKN